MTDPRELLPAARTDPTRDALLAAVRAHPDDDAPRLVLADWLDEFGDAADRARAEFVRVQCELARVNSAGVIALRDGEDIQAAWERLRAREQGLLDSHRYGWADGLVGPGWKTVGTDHDGGVRFRRGTEFTGEFRVEFRRGFVEAVTCSAEDWVRHAEGILAAHPVRRVTLTTWPGETAGWTPEAEVRADGKVWYVHWPLIDFSFLP